MSGVDTATEPAQPAGGDEASLARGEQARLTAALAPRDALVRRLPDADQLVIDRASTGHTNEMFRLSIGPTTWLLRRPPRVALAKGAHDMAREFRLLSALHGSTVPHADALLLCDDPDVIGAPFMISRFVDGFAPRLPLPQPFASEPGAARDLAFAMIDELAKLARFDWRARGLTGFGNPQGFLDRQVTRWRSQLDRYTSRPLPYLTELADWLQA